MEEALIECIPNFSEGRDDAVIDAIASAIRSVAGVRLLDVDPGRDAHRTVMTFAGAPLAVTEAAFLAIRAASALIDMRSHQGVHPRLGATDVCPLVPLSGITTGELVAYSRALGSRVGAELGIPVYLYEHAAASPARRSLPAIRRGEYEGLARKLTDPGWRPDFGPGAFNARAGATVIGVRDFLVAYNVNLNTADEAVAGEIACEVRERGRLRMAGGKPVVDAAGRKTYDPGKLKHVRGIGWYIAQYGVAQVSMNLTNLQETPVHVAFEACREAALRRGVRVTGSELVGLIPEESLLQAGRYYRALRAADAGGEASREELVGLAVRSLGLDELGPFDVRKKVIEYLLS